MIVANELRAAFSSWSDRLVAFAGLLIALVAVRSALSQRPFLFAATAVAAIATVIGVGAARLIERRLDFHAQDGVLAADVWAEHARRNYALSIHALVCAIVTIFAVIGRPSTAALAPIGFLLGAGIGHVAHRVVPIGSTRRGPFTLRTIRPLLQRPIAGVLAVILAMLPQLLLRSIEPEATEAFVVLISAVAALLLTMLDYHVVRFMTESGYSASRIIGLHARSPLIFLILTVVVSLVLSNSRVTIVIVGVVLVALLFLTSRILAYRVYSKRSADTLVSIFAVIAFITAVTLPMVLPLVALAMLLHLYHRARPVTWLLT